MHALGAAEVVGKETQGEISLQPVRMQPAGKPARMQPARLCQNTASQNTASRNAAWQNATCQTVAECSLPDCARMQPARLLETPADWLAGWLARNAPSSALDSVPASETATNHKLWPDTDFTAELAELYLIGTMPRMHGVGLDVVPIIFSDGHLPTLNIASLAPPVWSRSANKGCKLRSMCWGSVGSRSSADPSQATNMCSLDIWRNCSIHSRAARR